MSSIAATAAVHATTSRRFEQQSTIMRVGSPIAAARVARAAKRGRESAKPLRATAVQINCKERILFGDITAGTSCTYSPQPGLLTESPFDASQGRTAAMGRGGSRARLQYATRSQMRE